MKARCRAGFSLLIISARLINNVDMPHHLKLYVSDSCEKSSLRSLREAIHELPDQKFELTVINVREHPDWAEQDNVVATPTLIKQETDGGPAKRLIGCKNVTLVKHFLAGLHLMFSET